MERRTKQKMSRFLSHHLDCLKCIGSEKTVKIRRLYRYLASDLSFTGRDFTVRAVGSKGEGLDFENSDLDIMLSLHKTSVIQPNEEIPQRDIGKTVFVMDTTGCRHGYTLLKLHQVGTVYDKDIMDAIVEYNDGSQYLSSVVYSTGILAPGQYLHGPCATSVCYNCNQHEVDSAYCLYCRSWPDNLSDFRSRTKHCVWPSRQLVNHIVSQGIHFAAIGDKHSSLEGMQWRISFANAEQFLVRSFNHVQLKTYALLKIILKECLERDESIKDLLCSYFMKTIVFHAIEHSTRSMWVDHNIVQCFWFCFNLLLEFVQTGYSPNYFVLTHNMFLSNVTGENRRRLLKVLSKYQCIGWKFMFQCPSLQSVPQTVIESRSMYPLATITQLVNEELYQDEIFWRNCVSIAYHCVMETFSLANRMCLECPSDKLCDMVLLSVIKCLRITSSNSTVGTISSHHSTNKCAYTKIRRNKRFLHMSSETDVCEGLVALATFYYNTASYSKASSVATRVLVTCQQSALFHPHQDITEYKNSMCCKGYTLLQKVKRSYMLDYRISKKTNKLYPQELDLEVQASETEIQLPSLPYAVFLLVLCTYRLGDTNKAMTIFVDLLAVRTNKVYGAHHYAILHNLVGICHQLFGNTRLAIKSYEDSRRRLPDNRAAAVRIVDLRRRKREERGETDIDTLDYKNIPCRQDNEDYDDDNDDDDDMLLWFSGSSLK